MRGPKPKPFECPEPVFWYLVGLIASDGCLSGDGRHVTITAKDENYLEQLRTAARLKAGVTVQALGEQGAIHRIQIGSKALYQRLLVIGLTPRKSLTLEPLKVPDVCFADFFRGVIDGDGNIQGWCHPTNGREQWRLQIYGASRIFLQWLQETAERLWQVTGALHVRPPASEKHHALYTLKFGKIAAKAILTECYYPSALALERKRASAYECITAPVGWSKSKTVGDRGRWRPWSYIHTYVRNTPPDFHSHRPSCNTTVSQTDVSAGVAQLARRA